jgi:hypothetical protein
MIKFRRPSKQQVATLEEDPVTGLHWVLRIPVHPKYDIATAARLLGTSRQALKQRIQADKFEATEDGYILHATITKELHRLERRNIGRRYQQQLLRQLQADFEVEVPKGEDLIA